MFLYYTPEGEDERRWVFKPGAMPSHEAEQIEKRTGWTWDEFGMNLQKGSTLARRALLWIYLRREHPVLRFENVAFNVGEVRVELDRGELGVLRSQMEQFDFDDEATRMMALRQIDDQMLTAEDDPTAPKEESKNVA